MGCRSLHPARDRWEAGMNEQSFEALNIPPWIRWGQRQGAFVDRTVLTEHYRIAKPCGWCGVALTGRRTAWCSERCSSQFGRIWSWGAVSSYVRHRDGFSCRRCHCDRKATGRGQVDHILPVKDGGTDDPENLRLLCHSCHVTVGYEQRAARKQHRIAA